MKSQSELAATGTRWTLIEENKLIESLNAGKDIDEIAKEHKRTSGGIRARQREIAVRMIEIDGKSIEMVSTTLRLTLEEIEDAQKRRVAAKNQKIIPQSKAEKELDLLKDIRDILIRIESKLLRD